MPRTRQEPVIGFVGRDFAPAGPADACSIDITDIPTREGWLGLVVVEDLFGRRVVGRATAATVASRLVVDALDMAIVPRRSDAGLPAHSDRGGQYAGDYDRHLPAAAGSRAAGAGWRCRDDA